MIELGISSASFYPMLTEDAVSQIIALGYRKTEIFLNSECEFDPDYIQKLRRRLDDGGVEVVSVHPYTSAIEALFFFTAYPRRAEDALQLYRHYFAMSERLGAKYFTFHGDRNTIGGQAPVIPKDLHIEIFTRLADLAAEYGLTITQENVSWCASANPEYIQMLREALGERIGFTLDTKQARRAGVPIENYLSAMGKQLLNIHISDFTEENTCVLPGDGIMDYNKFFECLRKIPYSGALILEIYPTSFDNIRQIASSKSWFEHQFFKNP